MKTSRTDVKHGFIAAALLTLMAAIAPPAFPAVSVQSAPSAEQVPFDQAVQELANSDAGTRLRAARMLKEAAYYEAAVPLAKAVLDERDEVQIEAIAAELNIFLAEKIVPRKRVALVVEVRNPIAAEAAFSAGPSVMGTRAVPIEVLRALTTAIHDDNPRVGLEAIYTFGALAGQSTGTARRNMLRAAGPELAAMTGAADPAMRFAALRVMGRVFEKQRGDDPIETSVGDAVITALNEKEPAIRTAAADALGAMRYTRAVQALTDLYTYFGKSGEAEPMLDGLARIANPSSARLFTAALAGNNPTRKTTAAEGLARLGDRSTLAAIDAALKSERSEEAQLASRFASAMLGGGTVEPIVGALTRPALHDRARAYLSELTVSRTAMFARYLQDPDARIRGGITTALADGGDPAALPLVQPLVKDSDPQVARDAQRAVARLGAS
jgi:HEAT repeat protein